MTSERIAGTYLVGPEPLVVVEHDGGLVLSTLGVPPEFAARIVPTSAGLRIEGGPVDGAEIVFSDGEPCPGGTLGGIFEFTRARAESHMPGGRGLLAPSLDLSADERALYPELLHAIDDDADGGWLDVGDGPAWRFVEWLTREERVIFHGSPNPDIDVFRPVRTSVELLDRAGTGNLAAVYGTSFGLWAMWFAVLDRSGLQGSIQNGVGRWTSRSGDALDVYYFSVHHEHVGEDIWRPGTLYLLPRRTFRPHALLPGGPPAGEWSSPEEVKPLKRLAVDPDDFPFRDQVGGHDDTELIRLGALSDVVLDHVARARRIAGGLELTLGWDRAVAEIFDEYVSTARRFTPDVARELTRLDGEEAVLRVTGAAGFLQSFEGSLAKRGVPVDSRRRV